MIDKFNKTHTPKFPQNHTNLANQLERFNDGKKKEALRLGPPCRELGMLQRCLDLLYLSSRRFSRVTVASTIPVLTAHSLGDKLASLRK